MGLSEKASLGDQTGGSANKKKKSILKIQIQFDMCFLSYGDTLMSQDSREKFGVKTQISIGGGGGGGGEKESRERRIC